VKVVKALKRSNNGVIHAAVDMLCALMCVSSTFMREIGFSYVDQRFYFI
jgi:hypothetical protein